MLTQNTAWTNVEKAVSALRNAGALSPQVLDAIPRETLASLIRPAGYYNVKARRLHAMVSFLMANAGGDCEALASTGLEDLRERLLGVHGVGRETADSILLYALGKPTFVVDAYTRRIFGRLGCLDPLSGYEEIRSVFESALGHDADLYNDYHAQIVVHGKHVCRIRPHCPDCILVDLCGWRKAVKETPDARG